MKKIQALALLPVIALASCGKNEEVKVDTTQTGVTSENTSVKVEPTQTGMTTETTSVVVEDSTGETLKEGITSIPVSTEQSFEFTYKLGEQVVPVKGVFNVLDGKVVGMVVDGIKPTDKGPLAEFAKNAPLVVLGKDLKGLKIDSISGASLTTAGFNEYLATLK